MPDQQELLQRVMGGASEAPKDEDRSSLLGRMLLAQQQFIDPRDVRARQIEIYRNPNSGALPKAIERPTSLTKFQDRAFKSVAQFLPDRIALPDSLAGAPLPAPGQVVRVPDNRAVNLALGLGGATHSIGRDERGPYYSIFDSWDFDEPHASGAPAFMNEAVRTSGTPFNIYDRIYFAPGPGGTIPKEISTAKQRTTDIELPSKSASGKRHQDQLQKTLSRKGK